MRIKLLTVLAVLAAAPAVAQEPAAVPDFGALSDAELSKRFEAFQAEGFSDACRSNVPLFAELARRHPAHAGYEMGRQMAAAFCADDEGRHADALKLVKQIERERPDAKLDNFAIYLAGRLKDGGEALARLRGLAEEGQLGDLALDSTFSGLRTARSAGLGDELDEFSYHITESTQLGQLDPDLQSSFAIAAIRHAVRIADLSRVDALLASLSSPDMYLEMLSHRDFEAAWPQIGERAGDNLGRVAEAYASETAARLADKLEDGDRLSRYAHALYYAGRFQEAIDVTRNSRPDRDGAEGLEEGDAWSLNIESYALDALGRRQEADAVFERLAQLPADEYPWVVNFVINRASRLVGQERWEEGLAATELARTVAETHGSTYAKMLIARDRACALQRLGQSEEAEREAEFLAKEFNEAPAIAATGLMCLGKAAEAERLVGEALSDEVARDRLLSELQDRRFELFYTPSALPRVRELVLANAAFREIALKHSRLLPERFVPISYLRRMQIAQAQQ